MHLMKTVYAENLIEKIPCNYKWRIYRFGKRPALKRTLMCKRWPGDLYEFLRKLSFGNCYLFN